MTDETKRPGIAGKFATRDEELALIAAAKAGDIEARNLLITSNMGIIANLTFKAIGKNSRDRIDEWLGLAVEGWIKAIEKFDPAKGVRLSAYAAGWIWQRIAAFRHESRSIIRVPHTVHNGETCSDACREFAEVAYRTSRFTADTPEPVAPEPVESEVDHELLPLLHEVLDSMEPRLKDILLARMKGETLIEIGDRLGLTRERIRQLQIRAERLARDAVNERRSLASFAVAR